MFHTKSGLLIPGITAPQLQTLRRSLIEEYGITLPQLVEATSYSMAMVVRYALGLSAAGGRVACIFDDCLSGWISLATVRHLVNAGGEAELIFIGDAEHPTSELQQQLAPLDKMGLSVTVWRDLAESGAISEILGTCHNSMCGYFRLGEVPSPFLRGINDLLNELSTPIYSIECPPGVDPDTGRSLGSPLYASCTMALGAPLVGLETGFDYVGRLYVCDTSLTKAHYRVLGAEQEYAALFSDQPVQQINPSDKPF